MENAIQDFLYEFGAKLTNGFQRKHYISCDVTFNQKEKEWIQKHNETDVYRCSYAYENKDIENCNIISDLYLDFDGDIHTEEEYKELTFSVKLCYNLLQQYLYLNDNEMKLYFSGAKGFHIIVPYEVLGLLPKQDLNQEFKNLAIWLQQQSTSPIIDTAIYDRKRLLRIPNTINSKTGLYKVPITIQNLYNFSLTDMINYAKEKHKETKRIYDVNQKAMKAYKKIVKPRIKIKTKEGFVIPLEPQEMLPCAIELLKNGALEGERNNACVALASSLLQSGESRKDAYDLLLSWNDLNEPPLNEDELKTTFNSAYMMLQNGRRYGCTSYKDLGYCIGKPCKLFGRN